MKRSDSKQQRGRERGEGRNEGSCVGGFWRTVLPLDKYFIYRNATDLAREFRACRGWNHVRGRGTCE